MKATIFNKFSSHLGVLTTQESFMLSDNKLQYFGGLYQVNTQKYDGSL